MSFPKYDQYKESSIGWLGDAPKHWLATKMKFLGKAKIGLTYSPSNVVDEEGANCTLVLRSSNVQDGKIVFHDNVYVQSEIPENLRTEEGDILICSRNGSRALIGKNAMIDQKSAGLSFGAFMTIYRSDLNHYLFWVFNSQLFKLQSASFLTATINQLTVGNLNSFDVLLPPPEEQTAIANFLDAETSKIDALVSEQRRLIELLKEKRQAVISHAVTKGLNPNAPMKDSGIEWLGDVPEHWAVSRVKFMVQPNDGIQMGPFGGMLLDLDSEDTGYKVFGQENTISGDFTRGQRWVSQQRYEELERYAAKDGDLVLTRKGSLGNARLIEDLPQPGIIDSDTIRIRVDDDIIASPYLEKLLHEASYIAEQITRKKRGAILPGLNTSIIANLVVMLPKHDEQNELLSYLDSESQRFDTLQAEAKRAIELLQERRTALISAAVTGKIDVREFTSKEAVA